MTQDDFKDLKETYIEHIQQYIKDVGNLFPHITVFADVKNPKKDDKPAAIIHIPIPIEYMESDKLKDKFLEEVLPDVFKLVKKEFVPTGVAWGAEAWVRVVEKDTTLKDYKKSPIQKEVIFISIETKDKHETLVYDIERNGKQVHPDGSITDIIELTEAKESGMSTGATGRFTELFKLLENS
jgi:hypothetical protein